MAIAAGTTIGPYVVVAPLGAGGMGEVYRATDTRLGRDVAVKVLPEAVAADADRLERFAAEARAAAALSHPNVLSVFDVNAGGMACVVFELLEGETLGSRLGAGDLSPHQALDIACQVGRGLAAAHDKGIVHRDLKPDNVFLTRDGIAKILDFGLARIVEPAARDSAGIESAQTMDRRDAHKIMGTLGYMSPEQVRGLPADHRSDIFALGILLYEMLSGARAFHRPSPAETNAALLRDDPPPMPPGRGLSPALEKLLRRCLSKRPEDRFNSTRDLVFALEAVGSAPPSGADVPVAAASPVVASRRSIAVLPFTDLAGAANQDYFADGLAEELIAALSCVQGLQVASRTSSFQFRDAGLDVREIAKRLSVGTVLEGAVRRAANRLRVTVTLVDASDGYQLWSERFDRELADVFEVQEEIAASVAAALRTVLTAENRDAIHKRRTTSMEAWELYLRARQTLSLLNTRAMRSVVPLLERAIELDPGFALAHAALAEGSAVLHSWMGGREEDLRRAEAASRRALELGPELAEAHVAVGMAASGRGRAEEAAAHFETAMRIDPQLWQAWWLFGHLRFSQGRLDDAERLWEKAMALRPDDYQVPLLLPMIYRARGKAAEIEASQRRGIELARQHLAKHPDDVRAMYLCASALVDQGRAAEGLALLDQSLLVAAGEPATLYNAACVYAKVGERDKALETLAAYVNAGWGTRDWIANDSDFDSLRTDPRFMALVARAAN